MQDRDRDARGLHLDCIDPADADAAFAQQLRARALVEQVRLLQGPAEPGQGFAPVVISADKSVKYESVVQVMDKLQRAGIQRVGLSVQQQP